MAVEDECHRTNALNHFDEPFFLPHERILGASTVAATRRLVEKLEFLPPSGENVDSPHSWETFDLKAGGQQRKEGSNERLDSTRPAWPE